MYYYRDDVASVALQCLGLTDLVVIFFLLTTVSYGHYLIKLLRHGEQC